MNIAKLLRTAFLWNTSSDCFQKLQGQKLGTYLEPYQSFMKTLCCENSEQLMSVNHFSKRALSRNSPLETFLGKVVPKLCSKFRREHPCRSAISIKLHCNLIEITLRHGCSPVNLHLSLRAHLKGCFCLS